MSEQTNIQTIQALYEAFGQGDLPTILEGVTDDVDWRASGPQEIPYAGNWRGRDRVAQFFAAVARTLEHETFEPQEFIAQGDKVVVTGDEHVRVKSTGKTLDNPWVMVFTLREGKIAGFRLYEDTAVLVAALQS
ncbi:MAG: nuclear transport factor 2 family protein [Armatimonadota bacterium]|nr:nuclear transport factor 2 family protein [Armatimonadota bacterium]